MKFMYGLIILSVFLFLYIKSWQSKKTTKKKIWKTLKVFVLHMRCCYSGWISTTSIAASHWWRWCWHGRCERQFCRLSVEAQPSTKGKNGVQWCATERIGETIRHSEVSVYTGTNWTRVPAQPLRDTGKLQYHHHRRRRRHHHHHWHHHHHQCIIQQNCSRLDTATNTNTFTVHSTSNRGKILILCSNCLTEMHVQYVFCSSELL